MRKNIVIGASAVIAYWTFRFPEQAHWLVFVWLIPIFVCGLRGTLKACNGFLWGFLFFSLHAQDLMRVVIERGEVSYRYLLVICFLLYCALWSTFWLGFCAYLIKKSSSVWWRLGVLISISFFYFLWVDRFLFFIFDSGLGYPLAWPLLPLAQQPAWLQIFTWDISSALLLFFWLAQTVAIAAWWVYKKNIFVGGAVLAMAPFVYGWVVNAPHYPLCFPSVAYIAPACAALTQHDYIQYIQKQLVISVRKKPQASLFLMPESAFPYPLQEEVIALWTETLPVGTSLLLGAYQNQQAALFNCFFCINNSGIIHCYVKNNRIPFIEYVPPQWRYISWCKKLFLENKKEFSLTKKEQDRSLVLDHGVSIKPYICSELFFNLFMQERHEPCPLVCLVNDSWFPHHWMKQLLQLCARYRAVEKQCDIIYCAHSICCCINRRGEVRMA